LLFFNALAERKPKLMHLDYKRIFGLVIVFFFIALPLLSGQDKVARKAERKKELMQKLEKKYYKQARKKAIRHRREIQTQATQKRMKETDKKARRYNRENKTGWLEQQLCRKKPKR
jgi:hypothetical protein